MTTLKTLESLATRKNPIEYLEKCLGLTSVLLSLANAISQEYEPKDTTITDPYFGNIGPLSQEQVLEQAFSSHFLKDGLSFEKKRSKLTEGQVVTDQIRFTSILDGLVNETAVVNAMTKITKIMQNQGCNLVEIKPKLEISGYSDMTMLFSKEVNGEIVYFEVQVQSKVGLDAKKLETPEYLERKNLLDKLLDTIPEGILSMKDLRKQLNIWLDAKFVNNEEINIVRLGRDLGLLGKKGTVGDVDIIKLLILYKDSLIRSKQLYGQSDPVLYSKKSVSSVLERFFKANPEFVNTTVTY